MLKTERRIVLLCDTFAEMNPDSIIVIAKPHERKTKRLPDAECDICRSFSMESKRGEKIILDSRLKKATPERKKTEDIPPVTPFVLFFKVFLDPSAPEPRHTAGSQGVYLEKY